jgi:hypothetical protein
MTFTVICPRMTMTYNNHAHPPFYYLLSPGPFWNFYEKSKTNNCNQYEFLMQCSSAKQCPMFFIFFEMNSNLYGPLSRGRQNTHHHWSSQGSLEWGIEMHAGNLGRMQTMVHPIFLINLLAPRCGSAAVLCSGAEALKQLSLCPLLDHGMSHGNLSHHTEGLTAS